MPNTASPCPLLGCISIGFQDTVGHRSAHPRSVYWLKVVAIPCPMLPDPQGLQGRRGVQGQSVSSCLILVFLHEVPKDRSV